MERYGSDTDADEQEKPLLRRGHEEKIQRGERNVPLSSELTVTVQVAKLCPLNSLSSLFDGVFPLEAMYLDSEETCQTPARCSNTVETLVGG